MLPYFTQAVVRETRLATADDADACAHIHGLSFLRGWSAPEFEAMLADAQVAGHLLVQAGNGQADGFVLSRLAADQAEILSIALLPDLRGRRLAGGLLRRHMAQLDTFGIRKLFLEVNADNAAALALYRACRFVQVGSRKGYYATAAGEPADALVLCCEDLRQ